MKKLLTVLLALTILTSAALPCCAADADPEDIEGKVVIYTSMYPFAIDMMTEALKEAFPNLDAEFFYGGTGELQTKLAGEMGSDMKGILGCDMLMVAEPAFTPVTRPLLSTVATELFEDDQLTALFWASEGETVAERLSLEPSLMVMLVLLRLTLETEITGGSFSPQPTANRRAMADTKAAIRVLVIVVLMSMVLSEYE